MFLKDKPIDAVLAITYLCNSRCTMCDIWKIKENLSLDKSFFLKLPKTLRYINISGGEPFLHPDLLAIVKNVKAACPKAKIVISSNGFATDLIVKKMKEVLEIDHAIGIAFSLDGLEATHDQIRGIKGGFAKVMDTVSKLQAFGMKNIRFAFTISDKNITELNAVYDLAKEKEVEFTLALAQSSEIFFGGKENKLQLNKSIFVKEMKTLIAKQLQGFKLKNFARAFFSQGIYDLAMDAKQILPVVSGTKHFFLDPKGDVYPSVVHNNLMGNIKEQPFERLWTSKQAEDARQAVKNSGVKVWMICTARSAMRQHPLRVLAWVLKNKFI